MFGHFICKILFLNSARFYVHGVSVVLCTLVFFSACGGKKNSEEVAETAVPSVHGLQLVAAPIVASIQGTGVVQGNEETVVISKTSGTITRVLFDLGDRVRAGAVLVSVENEALRQALQQSEIELENAKKALRVNQSLLSSGAVSQVEVQSSRAQYYGALAQYKVRLEQYNDSIIKAPIDGYVVDKNKGISSGSVIGSGAVVGRISKRDAIKIEVAIADVYVPLIARGDTAVVRIPAIGSKAYTARISRISSAADTVTGTVTVTVVLDTAAQSHMQSQFRTGLVASVELFATQNGVYPIIPKTSIHEEVLGEISRKFVYLVQDASFSKNSEAGQLEAGTPVTVVKRLVQTGKEFVGNVEVHSGISESEVSNTVVLISGAEQLFEGARVLVKIIGATNTF